MRKANHKNLNPSTLRQPASLVLHGFLFHKSHILRSKYHGGLKIKAANMELLIIECRFFVVVEFYSTCRQPFQWLRLFSPIQTQGCKDLWNLSKSCLAGIHWMALTDLLSDVYPYSRVSVIFVSFFASICIGKISHQQHCVKSFLKIESDLAANPVCNHCMHDAQVKWGLWRNGLSALPDVSLSGRYHGA